ncbi:MAG: nucleotidyltransferase [Dehalococcoidia bacterium]|nr:nucleotidyltransferase [Dehalococcoidia bacterium]
MEVHPDFKELLELFNKHKVEYVVVGGYALAFHGAPRFTGDIDIFIYAHPENAHHVLEALEEFGFKSSDLTEEDFSSSNKVIQLGTPPVRVDIITSLTGVLWDDVVKSRVSGSYGGVPVFFISRNDFIKNKRAIGRMKDLADIEALGEE